MTPTHLRASKYPQGVKVTSHGSKGALNKFNPLIKTEIDMNTEFVKERLANVTVNIGDTKVIAVRPANGEADVQLVLAEHIQRPSSRRAVGNFMASAKSFGGNSAQPVWLSATFADLEKLLPQALPQARQCVEDQDYVSLDIRNPMLGEARLRLEITETHKPSSWEEANLEKSAKQDGQGNYLHSNGMAIFTNADVVIGDPRHTFIPHTGMTKDVYELDYTTGDQVSSEATEQSAEKAQSKEKELTA